MIVYLLFLNVKKFYGEEGFLMCNIIIINVYVFVLLLFMN